LRSSELGEEVVTNNPDIVEEISRGSSEELTKCIESTCSKPRVNISYVSSDDEDDDDVGASTNQYETKLTKADNVEVVVKTEKRSLVSGLYVEVPPRKKIRSAYEPKDSEENANTEEDCLSELLNYDNVSDISEDVYIRFDLDNFVIYDDFEKEIAEIAPERESKLICWDGLIIDDNKELFCKGANYSTFSISGYGSKMSDVEIMIQSSINENVWYNLLQPQPLYQRLWESFLWKARM
ncbi:1354_t:CDS:2, partial [Acaulospora morrowiae]